ncbi:MAG: hypothetical protein JNJ80_11250 [Gemmatimonadetes bacterium]|nr:hypothetical protein [Gemmatimonadota bacterium]
MSVTGTFTPNPAETETTPAPARTTPLSTGSPTATRNSSAAVVATGAAAATIDAEPAGIPPVPPMPLAPRRRRATLLSRTASLFRPPPPDGIEPAGVALISVVFCSQTGTEPRIVTGPAVQARPVLSVMLVVRSAKMYRPVAALTPPS